MRPAQPAKAASEARGLLLDLGAVARSVRQQGKRRQESSHEEDCENCEVDQASLRHEFTSSRLEADVLQCIRGLPVQARGRAVVAAAGG